MYDAITRHTYAELVKTAEALMPTSVNAALIKMSSRLPAVRDALVRVSKEKH